MTAYCMRCRTKREVKDPVEVTTKNGRQACKGTCMVCSGNIFSLGKLANASSS